MTEPSAVAAETEPIREPTRLAAGLTVNTAPGTAPLYDARHRYSGEIHVTGLDVPGATTDFEPGVYRETDVVTVRLAGAAYGQITLSFRYTERFDSVTVHVRR